jgi:hypothetical protein
MARPNLTFPPSNPDHLSMVSSQPSTMSTICVHVVYSPHLNVPLLEWNTSPQRQHNLFHVCPIIFFPYAPNQNATIPSFLYTVIYAPETGSILVSNSQISHKSCHTLHLTFNNVSAGSNVSNLSFTWITHCLISTDRSHVDAQSRLSVMTISPLWRSCHLGMLLVGASEVKTI